jgi:uncharacterized protein (DUF924 family)
VLLNPEEVLVFWFADAAWDPIKSEERRTFWFEANSTTDAAIAKQFAQAVVEAAAGHLVEWASVPRNCLALIILLDQFPRNLYRGTASAFQHDFEALDLSVRGLDASFLPKLSVVEKAFFLMPFEHSEDVTVQRRGVRLFKELTEQAPPEWKSCSQRFLDFARSHLAIIQRFGRFPHRNVLLGRKSTQVEIEYLKSGGESFGQAR